MTAVRELTREQQWAGAAAVAVFVSMFLPWYEQRFAVVVDGRPAATTDALSAFGVFSFVEAAILLTSAAVLYLLWARSQRRAFHLPGGDGAVVFAAGAWCVLLLVWRLFDRPDDTGIEWGIAFAFAAAAAMAAAGMRLKAAHVPEPHNPAATEVLPARRRRRRPVDTAAVTEVLRDPPDWTGEPPEPPERAKPAEPKPPPPDGRLF